MPTHRGRRSLILILGILLVSLLAGRISAWSGPGPGGPGSISSTTASDPVPAASLPPVPGDSRTVDRELEDLRQELEEILTSTGNRTGKWSVLAVSLDAGDTLLDLNSREPMVPASNMKVFTTAAALHTLGPDFRFTTFLLTEGRKEGSSLLGDLILYGTGDPTFSKRFFPGEIPVLDTLIGALQEQGIREVRGDLIIDGSYFRGPEIHPDWDPGDLNDHFAAPVAALGFYENLVRVHVQAGAAMGWRPRISLTPPGSGLPVLNTAVTAAAGTRSRIWLFRDTPWDPIGIEGEIPLGGRDVWRELPVPDPLVFIGRVLHQSLEDAGIHVTGHVRVQRDPAASVLPPPAEGETGVQDSGPGILAVHHSPPLLEILSVINKESNNLLAESVARTLGRLMRGDGSFEGGMGAVEDFLTRRVGISPVEVRVRDGSGLSPQNRASTGSLVRVLAFMAQSTVWDQFWSTLPEAGVRRELRRMGGTPASRNLRGKTGTMDGVSALSGMVRTRSGERVLFSILSNDVPSEYRAKRAEDQLGARLASLSRPLPPD